MPIPLTIRRMQAGDLDFAALCTAGEDWASENLATLQGFYLNDPQGCFLAELSGKPAGICIATPYGSSGFIGELIVRPEARGQGVGAALLNRAVDYLRGRGAETVYLDGVVKAVPLYERNGFRRVCRSLRFAGSLAGRPSPGVRAMQPADLPTVCALDRQTFGGDRRTFLARRIELYPELCHVLVEGGELAGFIAGRRGKGWVSAGPWVVAPRVANPLRLFESLACEARGDLITVGVLEINQPAVGLIRSLGFEQRPDCPWRMANGPSSDLGASPQCLTVGTAATG